MPRGRPKAEAARQGGADQRAARASRRRRSRRDPRMRAGSAASAELFSSGLALWVSIERAIGADADAQTASWPLMTRVFFDASI